LTRLRREVATGQSPAPSPATAQMMLASGVIEPAVTG
jgi:hypothetical protein